MEENTNINVFEEIEENYLRPFEYVKAHVNVVDEVPHSYSHQRNLELDQTSYIAKIEDHESMDSEVAKLLSKAYAFYAQKKERNHGLSFVSFHIRIDIARHVELQNVATTLMDQPHEHELGILIV